MRPSISLPPISQTFRNRPVFRPYPAALRERRATSAPPEIPLPVDRILAEFAAEIEPYPFGNGHPRFFGWVNSPPTPIAIFATALAAAMNPSVAGGNHAAVHIEHEVIGWFKSIFGFPEDATGLFVAGGSTATLTALSVARHLATRGLDRVAWDGWSRTTRCLYG